MSAKHLFAILAIGAIPLAGCLSPVRQEADALICHRAGLAVDVLPAAALRRVAEARQRAAHPLPARRGGRSGHPLPDERARGSRPAGWHRWPESRRGVLRTSATCSSTEHLVYV